MNDLIAVTAGWGVIALGVAGLYLFGRDPKANEHDLTDYHEPARPTTMLRRIDFDTTEEPTPESFSFKLASRGLSQMREDLRRPDDFLPPAPEGMNAGSPLYAGMLFDTWHPENPAEVAARFLREVGEDARAKAGIRPAYATADRDMTGAFPVVRAAA